jgi:hypothetical protein
VLLVEYEEIAKWLPKYDAFSSNNDLYIFTRCEEEATNHILALKFDKEGRLSHRMFWRNNQRHRPVEEGPAYESWHKGESHYWEYWQFGIEYNVDGTLPPSIIDPIV